MILKKPLVSVLMITYGHEKYIMQAIEGVLMQKCNFKIELIIANDCSPDNTCEVLKEIIRDHPRSSWIKYTRHGQNKGVQPNFIWAASQANAKYSAICEGDDYWTDPYKLQKQVDFMEENKNTSITCHNVERLDYATKKLNHIEYFKDNLFLDNREIITAGGKITPTLSIVFRSEYLINAPDWVFNSPIGDIPLMFYLMTKGKVYYFKNLMGVYRENLPGSWTINKKNHNKWKNFIFRVEFTVFIQKFNKYTHNKYISELNLVYNNENSVKYFLLNFVAYFHRIQSSKL